MSEAGAPSIQLVQAAFLQSAENFRGLAGQAEEVVAVADAISLSLRSGGKVMFCGNGGSAADAQHLAAELMGRFLIDREPLAAMALNVNTSIITAVGNDYGYDQIFSRQVAGIGRAGDVLIGLSTSGNSKNVSLALQVARSRKIVTIGLTGMNGGKMRDFCDRCICVPSTSTPRIQEMHIAVGHAICEIVEAALT